MPFTNTFTFYHVLFVPTSTDQILKRIIFTIFCKQSKKQLLLGFQHRKREKIVKTPLVNIGSAI